MGTKWQKFLTFTSQDYTKIGFPAIKHIHQETFLKQKL